MSDLHGTDHEPRTAEKLPRWPPPAISRKPPRRSTWPSPPVATDLDAGEGAPGRALPPRHGHITLTDAGDAAADGERMLADAEAIRRDMDELAAAGPVGWVRPDLCVSLVAEAISRFPPHPGVELELVRRVP